MESKTSIEAGRKSLASEPTSPSLEGHDDYTSSGHKPAKERDIHDPSESVYFARLWIKENPEAWARMVSIAQADAQNKRRVSIARLVEIARFMEYHREESKPFKVNNRLRPGLARILAHDYPEIAPFIEFRRAACDGMVRDV